MASSSLSSQFPEAYGRQCLTLFKLSFCTTPHLRSNLLWTHLPNRDDLFAVFDTFWQKGIEGSVTEKKLLKLIRGSELLETIELDYVALQAIADEERSKSQHLEDIDRHVLVMIKKPMLAIRFRTLTGQFKRFQMNFRPESGFDVAHSTLQALGLPILEKSQQAHPRTSIPPTPTLLVPSQGSQSYQPANAVSSLDSSIRPTTSNGPYNYAPVNFAPATSSDRPVTAPMTFSQMLPPRRELAFAKTLPEPQLPPASESPPANLTNDQAQCDQQTPAQTKARAKQAKATSTESRLEDGSSYPVQQSQSSTQKSKKKRRGRPAKAKATTNETIEEVDVVPDSQDPSLQAGPSRSAENGKPLPGSKINGRQDEAPSTHTQASNSAFQASQGDQVSPEEFMSRLDEWVRKYQDLPAPQPREPPPSDLAAYAAQSDQDRQVAIDSMICECLRDENFVKLVEDVDRSWRRLGLGF